MLPFRFTVRRMMVAVAIVAVAIGIIVQVNHWRDRARYYAARAGLLDIRARWERDEASRAQSLADQFWEDAKGYYTDPVEWVRRRKAARHWTGEPQDYVARLEGMAERQQRSAARTFRMADYHAALSEKCRRAARSPWLPVAPDPPEPK